MQRILNVQYSLPAHAVVTPECRDLLAQILVADPERRISLSEVQRHPWFRRDLPDGVADMNDRLLADPSSHRSTATQARTCLDVGVLSVSASLEERAFVRLSDAWRPGTANICPDIALNRCVMTDTVCITRIGRGILHSFGVRGS